MFTHHPLTEVGVSESQGHDDLSMSFHCPSSSIGIPKGILTMPQYIFPHVYDEAVEAGLIRYQFMKGIMEPGVIFKDIINLMDLSEMQKRD